MPALASFGAAVAVTAGTAGDWTRTLLWLFLGIAAASFVILARTWVIILREGRGD
jgi:hypothetical protein